MHHAHAAHVPARSRSPVVVRTHRASGAHARSGGVSTAVEEAPHASAQAEARRQEGAPVSARSHASSRPASATSVRIWDRVLGAYQGCVRRLAQESSSLVRAPVGSEARRRADSQLGATRKEMQSALRRANHQIRKMQSPGQEIVPSLTGNTQGEVALRRHRADEAQRRDAEEWLPRRPSGRSDDLETWATRIQLRRPGEDVQALPCDAAELHEALNEFVGHIRLLRERDRPQLEPELVPALLTRFRELQASWKELQAESWTQLATVRPLGHHRLEGHSNSSSHQASLARTAESLSCAAAAVRESARGSSEHTTRSE